MKEERERGERAGRERKENRKYNIIVFGFHAGCGCHFCLVE